MANVAVVWQLLDSFTPIPLRRLMMPLVRRLSKSVMFTGDSLEAVYAGGKQMNLPSSVYYPPVDTKEFRPSDVRRSKTRHLLGIPQGAEVVGMVANLSPMKGIEYFIRAATQIYASRPDVWFLLVGAPLPTHPDYATRVRREALTSAIPEDRIIFTGLRGDVENYYPAMDVKLITSLPRSEGVPTTAIEAMACGVPVVAANVGAVADVVQDGVTGLLVPALDAKALSEATISLLANGHVRAQMGQAARRAAIEKYDVEICADVHVRAFETALGLRRDLVRNWL
jgi:glycosyltransferase involved in cell wall biosynthesis